MIIGEGYQVLPTIVYSLFVDEMGGPPVLASAAASILVLCTSILLLLQWWLTGRRSYAMSQLRPPPRSRPRPLVRALLVGYAYGVVGLSLVPAAVVAVTSFFEARGPVLYPRFSLGNYREVLFNVPGAIVNSFILSGIATALGVALGTLIAYLVVRRRSAVTAALDSAVMLPYAIPGTVIGIAYIVAFNSPPLVLTGTAVILVLAYWVRRLPYSVRAGAAILQQIDPAVEEASVSLGVPPLRTFARVTARLMLPGIVSGAILTWVQTITEISATVFLYTAAWSTVTVVIYRQVSSSNFGAAAAASTHPPRRGLRPGAPRELGPGRARGRRDLTVSAGLEVSGLVKRYGTQTALDGVSVTAGAGEFFTLLGPSGCGKTTLLRCVAGFARPDGGRIVSRRRPARHAAGARAGHRDGLPELRHLPAPLGAGEHRLRPPRPARPGAELARRVGEALDLVQMAELAARMPTQLSGGQQQRVALARALVVRPRLLLMDEPLSNLDARLRVTMRGEIRRIQRELGITTLYVTHDQEEALAVSDRVAVMERGRVEQVGTPWEVYAEPRTAFVAQFVGLSNAVEGTVVARDGRRVTVDAGGLRLEGDTDLPDPRLLAVFRPEAVQLHAAGPAPAGPSGGEGRLAGAEFLGAVLRCGIRTAAGTLILADVHKPAGHAVTTEGQPMRFTIAPGDVRFFRVAAPR